jgi:PQQ-dependent dehydrogenase, methanol/ethanol family|nr:PQQ-dependent dehydrogenase, methanol/ethanol family [uncultured Steroidobacter sp.]
MTRGSTRLNHYSAVYTIAALIGVGTVQGCSRPPGVTEASVQQQAVAGISDWQLQPAYYSQATRIDRSNVARLGVGWEFNDFTVRGRTHRGMEATPIMIDGTLYVSGPWSVVYAIDARSGKERWRYDPKVDGQFARRACCDAVNRGVAVADGSVFVGTLDGYLVSIDAQTGKPNWKVDTINNRKRSYTITGAPRVAGDVVVIGNSGAELDARGYATAFDRKTGKLAWRFFVVPGDPANGDESPDVAEARKTWDPNSAWDIGGGGTVWDSIVYDPETNIVFLGTGNGAPHPRYTRSPAGGDNLYLSSIVAVDASTGRKRWHYQTTPGDSWDYTATQNMILADLKIGGRERKVIMQAPKNGFFYVLDRVTGELLSAEKYTTVTWAERVDMKTGRPVISPKSDYSSTAQVVWPSEAGGHNWQPMSFSAQTGLVYIPVLETSMRIELQPQQHRPYSILQGNSAFFPALMPDAPAAPNDPPARFDSLLVAWDPVQARRVWTSQPLTFFSGGIASTAGGLVFQGTADGRLTSYDARSGELLLDLQIGTGIMAAPLSYELDGVQYVAVAAGFGGAALTMFPPGAVAAERENRERLIVFKLDGAKPVLPPLLTQLPLTSAPKKYRGNPQAAARGAALYSDNCQRCHGARDLPGGYPNLWKMAPALHDVFEQIVLGGMLSEAGMASFADVLTKQDVKDIQAYLAQPESEGEAGKIP